MQIGAEEHGIGRLSTRIPGLGAGSGTLELEGPWMLDAAAQDPDVADFALRASDWWKYWFEALAAAPKGFFDQGCGW